MMEMPSFRPQEQPVLFELLLILQGSLDAKHVAPAVYPLLQKLIAADHFALCVSRTPDLKSFDWSVADMPSEFFRDYDQMADYDFVRLAVAKKRNRVLSDAEILCGQERALVQRNPFYQATRELHMPVEQVLGVMIAKDPSWVGGLTLYRDRARPFTAREISIFQFLTEYFAIMMGNCKRFGDQELALSNFDSAVKLGRTPFLTFDASWRWVGGSNDLAQVFLRCFGPGNRAPDGLPLLLREYIKNLVKQLPRTPLPSGQPMPWIPARTGSGVVVSFLPMVKEFGMQWFVFLDEIPAQWRAKLSPAEIDVAVRVAQGWDNGVVAQELNNISPATIRTHLTAIFKKLGLEGREVLVAQFKSRE
jgi:DNA-binding CsgD family transcriptional regulator